MKYNIRFNLICIYRDQFGDLLKTDDEPQTVEAMESRYWIFCHSFIQMLIVLYFIIYWIQMHFHDWNIFLFVGDKSSYMN